jgi:hypothetical protein
MNIFNWQPHNELESDVTTYLEGRDYYVNQLTYHAALPPEMAERLRHLYTPTALYIRGRAHGRNTALCWPSDKKKGRAVESPPLSDCLSGMVVYSSLLFTLASCSSRLIISGHSIASTSSL